MTSARWRHDEMTARDDDFFLHQQQQQQQQQQRWHWRQLLFRSGY